jgi:hypothetical protein
MTWSVVVAAVQFAAGALACWAAGWMHARADVPGGRPFVVTQVAIAWWAFTAGIEVIIGPSPDAILVAKVQYLAIAALPVYWIHFAAIYARRPIARSRWLLLTAVVPICTVGMAFTNEWHHWLWADIRTSDNPLALTYVFVRGPWFWVNWVHTYVLLLTSTWWLVKALARYHAAYSAQTLVFLIGLLIPWLANLLSVSGLIAEGLDLTPAAFAATGGCFAVGLLWYRR